MPRPSIPLPGAHAALQLCEEAGFVSGFLNNNKKRGLIIPDLREAQCESFTTYINGISAALNYLQRQGQISNDLLEKITALIPKYFGQHSALEGETIISLAILQWLEDRGNISPAVIYYPSNET